MLFTQLLLNACSLKVEHQYTLISYPQPDSLRQIEYTHTSQCGIKNLSPRVSVCRSGRQHGGQGSPQCLARKDLHSQVGSRAGEVPSPAWQSLQWLMQREISVAWSITLVCGARPSQQWSGACLSYTLTVVDSTLLDLFNKCLGPPASKWGICQEPIYGWSCSADESVLTTCADISGVSPCQLCLF